MADSKTIQRLPVGLLDLLGMQSTGDAPHLVAGEVQPTIEMLDMYVTDRLRGSNATTANVAAIGLLTSTVGPAAGEQWLCYGFTASSNVALAAATGYTANMAVNRPSVGYAQFVTQPYAVSNPAHFAAGVTYERPIIMRPGDTVGIWVSAVTGAPASAITVAAIYVPIRI